jgi:hypothetical protein
VQIAGGRGRKAQDGVPFFGHYRSFGWWLLAKGGPWE